MTLLLDQAVSTPMQESHNVSIFRQTVGTADHGPAPEPDGQPLQPLELGRQKLVRERTRNISVRQAEEQRCSNQIPAAPTQKFHSGDTHRLDITPTSLAPDSVSEPGQRPSKPLEQGRQKLVWERMRNIPVRQTEGQ